MSARRKKWTPYKVFRFDQLNTREYNNTVLNVGNSISYQNKRTHDILFRFDGIGMHPTIFKNQRWHEIIKLLEVNKLTHSQVTQYYFEAESWWEDPLSNLNVTIERYHNNIPTNLQLQALGFSFAKFWELIIDRGMNRVFAAKKMTEIINRIDDEVFYLTNAENRISSLTTVEYIPKSDRYYPKVNNKYLHLKNSTKKIEVIEDNLMDYAKWFKSDSEAKDFLKLYINS